jgi:serine/threonine protein kinase
MDTAEIDDLNLAIEHAELRIDPALKGGRCDTKKADNSQIIYHVGGFCIVYPFIRADGRKIAVRCWHTSVERAAYRTETSAAILKRLRLPYFVDFTYVRRGLAVQGGVCSLVRMDWIKGDDLKAYINRNLLHSETLKQLAKDFVQMAATLHKYGLSHGDLHPGNIRIDRSGQILLVDYDSIYHSSMGSLPEVGCGMPCYQHPLRKFNRFASTSVDHFSELVIFASIIFYLNVPSEYTQEIHDSERLLFGEDDYAPSHIIRSKGYTLLNELSQETKFLAQKIAAFCKNARSLDDIPPLENILHEGNGRKLTFYQIKVPVRTRVAQQLKVWQNQRMAPVNRRVAQLRNRRRAIAMRMRNNARRIIVMAACLVFLLGLGGGVGMHMYRQYQTEQASLAHVAMAEQYASVGSYLQAISEYQTADSIRQQAEFSDRMDEITHIIRSEVDSISAELALLFKAYNVSATSRLEAEIKMRVARLNAIEPDNPNLMKYKPFYTSIR